MVANDSRAWSIEVQAFWKRSFQASTGYVLLLSSVHDTSLIKLLGVRCVALKKSRQHIRQKDPRADKDVAQDCNVAKAKCLLS